jgi:hypothetical protein
MDAPQQRPCGQVGGRRQVAPQRAPENEGGAGPLRAEEGRRQRDPPGGARDDRRVALRSGERVDAALRCAAKGDAGVVEAGRGVMRTSSEDRQLEGHALVQGREGAGAVGRDVVGGEEDGARQGSASS